MRVGSLFSGIGGFDLGFERAGMQTVWQVEQEPSRRAVLARHFPDADRFDDVRSVGRHNLAPVDLICGGFPCQDISLAGAGAGIDGTRSGLWSEFARIIGELKPRWVVVENVPALTSRGLDRVLRDLAALGYDAEWDCIPASALGAPHRRDRVWIVAYPRGGGDRGRVAPNGHGRRPHGDPANEEVRAGREGTQLLAGASSDSDRQRRSESDGTEPRTSQVSRADDCNQDAADAAELGRVERRVEHLRTHSEPDGGQPRPLLASGSERGREIRGKGWWASEPRLARLVHGVSGGVDANKRRNALGDALVPQIAEWIGEQIMEYEGETALEGLANGS